MLSIITASKGRLDLFDKSVTSLWGHAADPDNVEHIVATDLEDHETHAFMDDYISQYPTRSITHCRMELPICAECLARGERVTHYEKRNIHRDYWNPIARKAIGDVVFGMGNDVVIETPGYDKIILEEVQKAKEKHLHSYLQILVDDDSDSLTDESVKPFDYCSWIILTKEAVKLLKGIAPGEIAFSGADQYVGQIFSNTLFPSQVDLRELIKTSHISHYTGKQHGPDAVTQSHPLDQTDWEDIARKQYDLALDYAIIKQAKWVMQRLKRSQVSVDSTTLASKEKTRSKLLTESADGRGGWQEAYFGNKMWGRENNPWAIHYPGDEGQ